MRMKSHHSLGDLFKTDPFHSQNGSIFPLDDNSTFSPKGESILLKKIEICKVLFDHSDTANYIVESREFKRRTLVQISEFIGQERSSFELSDEVLRQLFIMFSANIFRVPPASNADHGKMGILPFPMESDEEKTTYEPSWPHLHIVYDMLLKLLLHVDPKVLLKESLLDKGFILRLVELFDSEDPREREVLKTMFHRIYGRFTSLRSFMRRTLKNVFLRFIYESESHNGIGELLEIFGSIINGFMVPLKEEHKQFLMRVLIPLHKPKCLHNYHIQLQYCVSQFVQKDCKLMNVVIRGLIKIWPVTNCQKQVLLLAEVEEVLDYSPQEEFSKAVVPLAKLLARCLSSSHLQVAERSLCMWNSEQFVKLVSANMEQMMPMMVAGIEKNIREHWSQSIQDQTLSVKEMLQDMDSNLFESCLDKFQEEESKLERLNKRREQIWNRLEFVATLSSPSRNRPLVLTSPANGAFHSSFTFIEVV